MGIGKEAVESKPLTVHSGSNGITRFVYQNTGIIVKFKIASIRPPPLFPHSYNDGMSDISSTDFIRNADTRLGTKVPLPLNNADNAIT